MHKLKTEFQLKDDKIIHIEVITKDNTTIMNIHFEKHPPETITNNFDRIHALPYLLMSYIYQTGLKVIETYEDYDTDEYGLPLSENPTIIPQYKERLMKYHEFIEALNELSEKVGNFEFNQTIYVTDYGENDD